MKHPPTDLEILREIYRQYYDTFAAYSDDRTDRASKIYVPIDIDSLAERFNTDGDIIFGRLYYHLDKKHGYRHDDGPHVHLFAQEVGPDRHCVNFLLVASVFANLSQEDQKFRIATLVAVIATLVALFSLIVSSISLVFSVLTY